MKQQKVQGKLRQILLDHFQDYLDAAKKSQDQPEQLVEDVFLPNGKKRRRKKKKPKIIRVRPVEIENVFKTLVCRTGILGYHWHKCPLDCGFEVLVPHSCKSRFCSCCGYVATENWIDMRFNYLLDCPYQHLVVTIPRSYNWMIKLDRKLVLNFYLRCAVDTIQEWAKKRGFKVAMVTFYHSFGGRLQFHPHFHLLVTSGGITPDGQWKMMFSNFPGNKLMEIFKKKFVSGLKKLFRSGKLTVNTPLSRVLWQIEHPFGTHWQFYVKRITRRGKETVKYCVRYAKKMIISEKRIVFYDGNQVQYECSKSKNGKKTKFIQHEDAVTFIGKVVPHIPPKHFKLIRNYGFYANNKYTKEMYDQARSRFQPLDAYSEKDNWRHRQWRRNKKDPLTCPNCNVELVLVQVTFSASHLMYNWDKILAANHQTYQQRLVMCSTYSERKIVQPISNQKNTHTSTNAIIAKTDILQLLGQN